MRKLDIGLAWRDAMAMLRANSEVIALLSGLFFLIPTLLWTLMAADPPQRDASMSKEQLFAAAAKWFYDSLPWMTLATVLAAFGSLAIWRLLLAREATVGQALSGALRQFLPYVVAMLLFAVAFGIGWTLFILPGLWLYSRLALIGPHMAATGTTNPIESWRGSWRATKGNAFWTLLLLMAVILIGFVIIMIVGGLLAALLSMTLGAAAAVVPIKVVNGLLGTGLTLVLTVVGAAIYRQIGTGTQIR